MRIAKILMRLSALAGLMVVTSTGNAALSCKNVTYGDPNYLDDYRERVGIEARLREGYVNRYHDSLISDLCNNENNEDDGWATALGVVIVIVIAIIIACIMPVE